MKILIPLVGSFGKSGGFRVMSQLANHWISSGHEVVFLSYANATEPYFPTKATILYYDNNGGILKTKNNNLSKLLLGMFSIRKALRLALDNSVADIVLANHCFSAYPVANSKINAKKFYYIQAYEPEYYGGKGLKNKIYKQIAKKSYFLGLNHIVNADMYQDYKEIKASKVVYPGLDLDNFKSSPKYKTKDVFVLGSIGREEVYKGTNYILEAFAMLRKKYDNKIELHLAFGLKEWNELEGVSVLYPNGDDNLAKYYNSIDAYICAGTVQLDAIHYPILESFACKTPVITTGYYPADDSNAWVVPIKNADAIKKMVISLIDSLEISKAKSAIAYAEIQKFSWDNISNKMLNYFLE